MKVTSLSFLILFAFFVSTSYAQKVGHLSSVQLIDSLPEAKLASKTLRQYEASLNKAGDEMLTKYQEKVKKYQIDMKAGSLTTNQQKQVQSELELDNNALSNYRESVRNSLEKKRQELVQPILDKINKAIKELGVEENYLFIFDSSAGLLYFKESEDVSSKIFKKLGQ